MPIQETRGSSIQTGNNGWISIHINDPEFSPSTQKSYDGSPQAEKHAVLPAACHVFEHAQKMPTPLAERFPRLTFLAIALTLLASALTAEFDYLRGAGYYWP
jgi:hypothetical protein